MGSTSNCQRLTAGNPCSLHLRCSLIANTGPLALASRPSCRCRAPKWIRSVGIPATSSWLPATPTSIIRASAWRSSAGCWKRKASGSGSSPSPTGIPPNRSAPWGNQSCFSASRRATWIRWSTAIPRIGACATTTLTPPTTKAASGPTGR